MIRLAGWLMWHLHRRGLLGWGIAGFLLSFFYGGAFIQAAGSTAASQAAFGHTATLIARDTVFLVPLPTHPETLGGYVQWKLLAFSGVLFMIWAAVAAVGITRGAEDRGLTDSWLAAGLSRTRLLLARSAAFALAVLVVTLACGLGVSAVAPLVHQDANVAGEIGKALSTTAGVWAGFALTLLVAQLPRDRGTGTAIAVGLLVLMLIANGVADSVAAASGVGLLTPYHWMNLTTSGAPGGVFDAPATLGLVAVAAVLLGAAGLVFNRRDVGSGLLTLGARTAPPVRVAATHPMLREPALEGLWEQRVGLAVWAGSTLLLGVAMVAVTRSMADALFTDPTLAALFQRVFAGDRYMSLLGFVWFSFALLVVAGYSVVQASRWAAQDQEGRVEALLSAPVSRTRVVVDRAVEYAAASLLIVAAGYVGVAIEAPVSGMPIDGLRLFEASALMWPFGLAFGGLAVAVASRWPRIAVPALAAFAVIEYFLGDLAPIFKFPGWVADLSVFHLFGNPLTSGVQWSPAIAMVLVFAAGFAAALFLMNRRDIASG